MALQPSLGGNDELTLCKYVDRIRRLRVELAGMNRSCRGGVALTV
jgi:hypothetical protein